MRNAITAATCGLFIICTTANAAEVTGSKLEFSHSAFTANTAVAKTELSAGVEIGFNRSFSTQFDFALTNLNTTNRTVTSTVAHAIFHASQSTSLGGFLGFETGLGTTTMIYGLEVGHGTPNAHFEAYVARAEDNGANGTLLGVSGRFPVTQGFAFGASVDHVDVGGLVSGTRVGLSGDVAVSPSTRLFGEIGTGSVAGGGVGASEPYVKLGARINFGASRGTTFGKRSSLSALPGL